MASSADARKWSYARRPGRRGVLLAIRRLVVRMAEENPTWGYTRIQGALKNVGHHVGRSTIRRILKAAGMPPVPQRPTSWQTLVTIVDGARLRGYSESTIQNSTRLSDSIRPIVGR